MVESPCKPVEKLWFVGNEGVKNGEKAPTPDITHIGGFRLGFTFRDTISGDFDLVWFQALMKPYWSALAAIAGKLLLARNLEVNIGCMGGLLVPKLCLPMPGR